MAVQVLLPCLYIIPLTECVMVVCYLKNLQSVESFCIWMLLKTFHFL